MAEIVFGQFQLQDGMAELRKNLNAELMGVLSHISLVENLNEMRPTQDYENPFPLLIQQLEECRQRQDEQLKTFMDLFKTLSL